MVGGLGGVGGHLSEGNSPDFQKLNVKVERGLDADKKFSRLLYWLENRSFLIFFFKVIWGEPLCYQLRSFECGLTPESYPPTRT